MHVIFGRWGAILLSGNPPAQDLSLTLALTLLPSSAAIVLPQKGSSASLQRGPASLVPFWTSPNITDANLPSKSALSTDQTL